MANVLDYIRWRGDIGFDERPLNEVDSLILCQISYIDMRAVFPEGEILTVRDAVDALLADGGELDTLTLNGEDERELYTEFARAAAASRRFGPLLMEHYVDIRDKEKQTQFSAVTFRIGCHAKYVAFRGTDDSIVGWKEDFMISFERVPAQDAALTYLMNRMEETDHNNAQAAGTGGARTDTGYKYENNAAGGSPFASLHQTRFHVGGHSKGANLALYAAVLLPKPMQERLVHVHLYDGPGLCADVPLYPVDDSPADNDADVNAREGSDAAPPAGADVYSPGPAPASGDACARAADCEAHDKTAPSLAGLIAAIDPIATKIVPEYDVVGKIFEMPITDNRIVRSNAEGVMQHGILTWQLTSGGEFDLVSENAPGSIWIGKAMDSWIGGVENTDRAVFIDELFDAIGAAGESLSDLGSLTADKLEKIIGQVIGMSPVAVDVAVSLPIAATTGVGRKERSSVSDYILGLFRHNTYSRALLLLGIGLCCLAIPENLLPLTLWAAMTAIVIYVIFYYIKRLWQLHGDFRANQTQGYICLGAVLIYVIVLVKQDMLMMISNMVYGGVFLFLSYHIFQRLNESDGRETLPKAWSIAEGVALIVMAVLVLTVPTGAITSFTLSLGCILILDGIAQLIHVRRIRRRAKKARRQQHNNDSGGSSGDSAPVSAAPGSPSEAPSPAAAVPEEAEGEAK